MNRENIRFEILALLYYEAAYTANQETLLTALHGKGFQVTRAQVRNELNWLGNIEAITLRDSGGVDIATLSDTGAEHVEGFVMLPGIRKPRPGEIKANG